MKRKVVTRVSAEISPGLFSTRALGAVVNSIMHHEPSVGLAQLPMGPGRG